MPGDWALRPVTDVPATSAAAGDKTAGDKVAAGTTDPAAAERSKTATPAPGHPNPSLRLDPALGLVVIEFRDESGDVSRSIPSVRQLEAYRRSRDDSTRGETDPRPGRRTTTEQV